MTKRIRIIILFLIATSSLLLSGYFAEYVHDQGGLTPGYDFAELQARGHINPRALAVDTAGEGAVAGPAGSPATADTPSAFSRAIRQGVPGIPQRPASTTPR